MFCPLHAKFLEGIRLVSWWSSVELIHFFGMLLLFLCSRCVSGYGLGHESIVRLLPSLSRCAAASSCSGVVCLTSLLLQFFLTALERIISNFPRLGLAWLAAFPGVASHSLYAWARGSNFDDWGNVLRRGGELLCRICSKRRYLLSWERSGEGGRGSNYYWRQLSEIMAMASALPWVAPATHLNFLHRSACKPALLSPFAHAPIFFRGYHIHGALSRSRRIIPSICGIIRQESCSSFQDIVGGSIWSRRLGFLPLKWTAGEKFLSSAISASKNLNAESFDTSSNLGNFVAPEIQRLFGRDELADQNEDSESDDEDDELYFGEDEDEDEDYGFEDDDIDNELLDNEEDAEATVIHSPSEKSIKDRERLKELCARVEASGERTVTAADIAGLYDFPFDKFQRMSIEGFLKGSSLVVCAPTSSGKTLVAEAAAAATIARGKRLFYTTPLKALSNQKLRDFRELFGEENVGLVTGDAAVNREAPILIMTTEILRNMLYQSVGNMEDGGRLMNVDVVVLDEVHYLSDISRGTVWEETVIYCPKEVQLICLSATVANPEELAGWIAQVHGPTELVTSSRRPVPLVWHFSTRYGLNPLLNEQGDEMNWRLNLKKIERERVSDPFWDELDYDSPTRKQRKFLRAGKAPKESGNRSERRRRSNGGWGETEEKMSDEEVQFLRRKQVPQIRDTLNQLKERDMLPAIWFIFSRRGCDLAVHYLLGTDLLTIEEQRRVRKALDNFREQHPDSVREVAVKPLLHGVAAHHAGCLPTWKAFIEELFQQGLIKVVFATETLAAGINMPARTTVLASLSKRGDNGHQLLSANSMLQMAGRAGRRGIDEQGHTVVVQTPFEGAEDCCKLLFAGPDPLVSQFTATYGMALNLLAGARVKTTTESGAVEMVKVGRSLDEARALIEKSFGNYVGSEVMVAAKQQLARLQKDIEYLEKDYTVDDDLESRLTRDELQEYLDLKEKAKEAKRFMREQRREVEQMRVAMVQPLLDAPTDGKPPFICLSFYEHRTGEERRVPALFVGCVPRPPFVSDLVNLASEKGQSEEFNDNHDEESSTEDDNDPDVLHYVALGSDNAWYMFTARSVKSVHTNSVNFGASTPGGKPVEELLKEKLQVGIRKWENLGRSGSGPLGCVWSADSSIDTWGWGCQVPVLSELSGAHEVSLDLVKAERVLLDRRKEASKLRKKLKQTQGYRESRKLVDLQRSRFDKLQRITAKANRISNRISQMQPSGWKEFLQVVKVLQEAGALKPDTNLLTPLGEVAASTRGVNELWLAIVFTSGILNSIAPAQLAAACACLVSDGMKARSKDGPTSSIYDASDAVNEWAENMEEARSWLVRTQSKHGVAISVEINTEFAGLVEAWAAGVTWKELMDDIEMDEGDVARLLRRSIDLLAQIPHLPHIDPNLAMSAREASNIMDRPPISELLG
uniref:Uncharacterized protein n=1 Tax=Physcomitrium patens TaxID=3218 RepID=A0A2K1KP95_PHYPA|nr:hypothetical protein PHYPA_006500 [Physcomitrium patens]